MALSLDTLLTACQPGGASVITGLTELEPAAGPHAGVAPARYVSGRNGTYAFETRHIDGSPQSTVLIDSKSSTINRSEDAIARAVEADDDALTSMPHMVVSYPDGDWTDYQAPHRFTDGHFRAATVGGEPVTDHPTYRAARDATPADARPVLELSPLSLVHGAWDSTRRSHQARYRSALVGEVIGVLSDQSASGRDVPKRGGARRDEISPSVRVSGKEMESLLRSQESELSPGNVKTIREAIKKAGKDGAVSAAALGLGSIPPQLETLGLVACSRIIRSHVLSVSTLRQLRFGSPGDGDIACRALLAALALYGVALSNEELLFRANCDLVEKAAPVFTLDARQGRREDLGVLDREIVRPVLLQAIDNARQAAGVRWQGQAFRVDGNPIVAGGVVADVDEA